jgi:hypothetical protein
MNGRFFYFEKPPPPDISAQRHLYRRLSTAVILCSCYARLSTEGLGVGDENQREFTLLFIESVKIDNVTV